MKKTSGFFRRMTSVFLALTVMLGVTAFVANAWTEKVNELLGVTVAGISRSDNPSDYRYTSTMAGPAELIQAEIDLNTRLAAEGSVALKGQPAIEGRRVTLFGMRSGAKMQFGGSMGELIDASNVVTLDTALEKSGFTVNPDMVQFYRDQEKDYAPTRSAGGNVVFDYEEEGAKVGEVPVSLYDERLVGDYTDAAIIVLGRDAGESACFYPGADGLAEPEEFTNSPTGNILSLTNDERDLVNWVKQRGFKKIVVLLNSGTAMEIEELKQDPAVDVMLWIGNPGAYGTFGIARLLSGEALPSGHLPDTFAVNSALSPAARNFGIHTFANPEEIETTKNHGLRAEWYLVELEGIYTGYKYYETRYFDAVMNQGNAAKAAPGQSTTGASWNYDREVSYTFGYGLEGSSFSEEITGARIDWTGEQDSTVTVRVTNTGDRAAKHAVQLYVSVPYTQKDRDERIEKAAIQLIGYAKTGEAQEKSFRDTVLLQPGESEEVTVTFNAHDFYSYDMGYAHDGVQGAWLLESGDYYFATGNGAHEAVNAVLNAMNGTALATTGTVRKESVGADVYQTTAGGVTVQNQLGDADLNRYQTGVEAAYLTRNDWLNTFPRTVEGLSATQDMIYMLRNATYNQELENSLYTGPAAFTYGAKNGVKAVDLVGLPYDDPKYGQLLDQLTLPYLINQYIAYLEENKDINMPIENRADSPLGIIGTVGQRTAGSIYAVSADTEGFKHHTDVYVGAPVAAATFSPSLQTWQGRLIGEDCLWAGYNNWYGPGMNLHRTPYNGRNIAYYSEDSVLTGRTGAFVHQGLNQYGVSTQVKHFAFNDQETNRDGVAMFMSEQAARENELRGFEIGIRDGHITGLMSAFNRVGCTHAGAHRGLMNGILRGEWGWQGYLMTDSVKSTAYFLPRECLMAGNDMMLGGSANAKVWQLSEAEVKKDIVVQAGLRESYHRKLYSFVNSNLLNGMTSASSSGFNVPWWLLTLLILLGICFALFVLFIVKYTKRLLSERRQ